MSKKGIISNNHGFFNRHLDTGFKTKWSGYWTPPYKFLDYYAIKINGLWLDQDTLEAVDYDDKIVFHHETESFYVKEIINTPQGTKGFNLELKVTNQTSDIKAAQIKIEMGVDIRKRDIDIPNIDYSSTITDDGLKIDNNGKKLHVNINKCFDLTGEENTKEHYPNEAQKCFIPGQIQFREEITNNKPQKVKLEFRTFQGDDTTETNSIDQNLDNNRLGRLFDLSHESLTNLIYTRKEPGIAAGHPWFQNFWGRDTFWSLLGLIDLGHFDISHKILENYAEKEGFPTRINLEGENEYHGGDEAPLFLIASEKLERHHEISDIIKEKQEEAFQKLEISKEGYVMHSPQASWMDTLERPAPTIDIQSLWLEAARRHEKRETASKLKQGLNDFVEKDYIKDTLTENSPVTINPTIPLMFGQIEKNFASDALETINGELSSRYGARTLSFTEPGYQADGYHTGSVWGLTTCWAAIANFKNNNYLQGKSMLEKFENLVDKDQPGAFPEVVNAETGNLMGCSEQAWSAGLLAHAIDTYLLGIKVKEDKLTIKPSGPVSGVRESKKVKDEVIDIEFEEGKPKVIGDTNIDIEVREYDSG